MAATRRPNFLLVVADDLGYSDIGCYGGEIHTPNIDKLAAEGLLFTDFHASAACSPTRSMLLSGTDSHLAGVGVMSEARGNDLERWNKRGHEGYLNYDVAPLPQLLQDAGYHTMMSGKWHLGLRREVNPAARGFDRSFALLPGACNHWAYEPQFDWENEKLSRPQDFFERIPNLYTEDNKRKVFSANTQNKYESGYYSSEYYTDNLLRYFKERTSEQSEQPFFAFLPFSAPHWPLQCSKEDRERYKGVYDDGPAELRKRRLAKLKELSIIPENVAAAEVYKVSADQVPYPDWDEYTPEERAKSARAMECFAGMVDNIDQNVGKVINYLEQTGELDNTLIMFLSDNGAEGASYESLPVMGKDLMKVLHKYYNNTLDNIGNHDSFVWYGPRWAQAATAPSRLYKNYSTEGGIRVPLVARFPPAWPKGKTVRSFSSVMDILPTFLDLAGVQHPVPSGQLTATFHGHEVYGVRGKSWAPILKDGAPGVDNMSAIWGDTEFAGWELFGRAGLRMGKWKIVYMPVVNFGKGKWELYDLTTDLGETNDLADSNPEKLAEMLKAWDQYVLETGAVWGPEPKTGSGWATVDEDTVGGDPIAETKAWMSVGEGQTSASRPKHT